MAFHVKLVEKNGANKEGSKASLGFIRDHFQGWFGTKCCSFEMMGPSQEMFIFLSIKWEAACHMTTACDPIMPSLCIQSNQRTTAMISWCLRISVPPPALTMSWLVQESRILPGNRLGFHTHKKVTRGTGKRPGEEEHWGDFGGWTELLPTTAQPQQSVESTPPCDRAGGENIMADGGMLFLHYQEICTLGVFCARLGI